jgi:cytidylate kinase
MGTMGPSLNPEAPQTLDQVIIAAALRQSIDGGVAREYAAVISDPNPVRTSLTARGATMAFSLSPPALTEALVRANQHWQLRHQEEGAASEKEAAPAFTIALSREAGTYGAAIARAVADRLGWPVYDSELLQHIATDMGVRKTLLSSMDERHVSWLSEYLEGLSPHRGVSQYAFLHRLLQTILSLAAHGNCVIVGRGATKVLPAATTLRVRIVAPRERRIEAVQHEHGISREEARRRVEATDRERDEFVREHFNMDATDPRNYDLLLNAARFPIEQCAELIIAALDRLRALSATASVAPAVKSPPAV